METYNKDNAVIREAIRKSNKTKQDKIDKITSNYHRLSNELRGKISKPISEFENELFELRIKNLKDTLSKLTSKNKYDYLVGLKRSALEELTFIYDHTEIDRNVYREEVKKQIATRRHKTVIAETKVADAEKKYQDYQTLMDFENRYALEIDNAKNKTFEDYQAINPTYKPLKDLYAEIDENFEKYAQEEKEFINNLINTHLDFIKEHYNNHLLIIPKIQNYDAGIELLNKKKEIAELEIQKANVEAEIYVYEVSISEKIEVSNKLKLVQEELSQINEKLEKLYVEANDLNNVYQNSLQYLHDLKKNSIKELKNKKANEQSDLNQKIKEAILKETDLLENLLNVFATEVKKNFISYEEFKNKALLENSKKEIEYRKEKLAAANTEEEKEAYSLPIDKYLAKLTANYAIDNENKIQEAKKNYQENVKKINEDYKNDLLKIKEDRKNRKEIYLDKKAETKLKIKNADSSEVSELKEILKIYKKDIKAGDWKRRHKVKKDYKAKLAKAKFDYEILINELTKQKSYVLEVKRSAERKEIEKTINKDNRYLNRSLRKERHLTRYRKNMNKAKRDAILGYAFLAIWGIGFIIFTLIPIFYSLVISLSNVISDVNGYTEVFYENGKLFPAFTGLDNYYSIFLKDVDFFYTQLPTFLRSLILFSPIVLFISFVIAILLNTKIVGRTFFRIIYFLPVIIVSGPLLTLLNESPNSSGGTALTLSLDGTFIYDILLVAGEKVTGTMPNNGKVTKVLDTETTSYTIAAGYHNGEGTVSIVLDQQTVTPTKAEQVIEPEEGQVLSQVTVNAIPDNYIDTTGATATAAQILTGVTAYVNGSLVTGTMPNNDAVTETLNTETTSYTVAAGYHNGEGTVSITVDSKEATPTKSEQTIEPDEGHVLGTVTVHAIPANFVDTSDATATAADVLTGKNFYLDNVLTNGTMPNNGAVNGTITGLDQEQEEGEPVANMTYTIPAGYTTGGTVTLTNNIETLLAAI